MTNRSSCEIWSRGQQTGHDYLEASLDDRRADKLDHLIDHHSNTNSNLGAPLVDHQIFLFLVAVIW